MIVNYSWGDMFNVGLEILLIPKFEIEGLGKDNRFNSKGNPC